MLTKIPADTALANLKSSNCGWWSKPIKNESDVNAAIRLQQDVFRPVINPRFRFPRTSRIFAMGSCFVRVIEKRLIDAGFSVPDPGTALAARWKHRHGIEPFGPWDAAAYLNKYNSCAMLYEARRACLGPDHVPEFVIPLDKDHWIDIGAANVLADETEAAVRARREIVDRHSAHMCDCDIFILTLGLTEGWYHPERGVHINDAANVLGFRNRSAFEFVVFDFNDHMAALEELHTVVKQRNPKCRFIVTVSPVPLQATFTGQDVVVANMFSKSTLRAVAGAFCAAHPDADYFPSYEMVMLSNQAKTWKDDRRHVDSTFSTEIAKTFIDHYIE